jgi:hypothetical protein
VRRPHCPTAGRPGSALAHPGVTRWLTDCMIPSGHNIQTMHRPLSGMRYRMQCVLAAAALAGATVASRAADIRAFDGIWAVTVICETAPDGAKGYTWMFRADVHDGALLGHYNPAGAVPSGTLSGQINSDGSGVFVMRGLTGDRISTVGRLNPGSPFSYTANVHFNRTHGTGKRNELRACGLDFVRE